MYENQAVCANTAITSTAIKSRGTSTSPGNRFHQRHSVLDDSEQISRSPETELLVDHARSIISRNNSPDIPFSQSVNPYKGCEHGCVYCYARPSHEYLDLSAGLDFESKIFYKPDTVKLLRQSFSRPGYECSPLMLGANTDPYQPAERELQLTRGVLELCLEYRHPVSIITKGALVLRDIDLISELASVGLCNVLVSLTTLDLELKNRLEPRTAAPAARLRVLRELAKAGVPTGVMAAPIIPFINDHELESLLQAAVENGASGANYVLLRLPLAVAELFKAWLQQHYPDRAKRVMHSVQASRNGKDYQGGFGRRMRGEGVFADLLAQRFAKSCARLGLASREDIELDCSAFRYAAKPQHAQLDLF